MEVIRRGRELFNSATEILDLSFKAAQMAALIYAGYKFTRKPHDTLEKRVADLEDKNKEIELEILKKDERIREIEELCGVIIRSVIALIEFEMQYCLTENKPVSKGLEKAKETLDDYFAKKK